MVLSVRQALALLLAATLAGAAIGALPAADAQDGGGDCPRVDCGEGERPGCWKCFADHGSRGESDATPEICHETTSSGCGCDPAAEAGAPGYCVVEGPDAPDLAGNDTCEPQPTGPPPRPSLAHATLPAGGDLEFDPPAEFGGITGMETVIDLRWDGPTEAQWTVEGAPGVTADCELIAAPARTDSARIVEYKWDLRERVRRSHGPTVHHTYETKDRDQRVEVWAVWATSWGQRVEVPMADAPYPVTEVRSRLIGAR